MDHDLRRLLEIPPSRLEAINAILLDPDTRLVNDFLAVVAKYGTPQEINQKAAAANQLPALLKRVEAVKPEFLKDLEWLAEQRDRGAFISVADYRHKVLGAKAARMSFQDDFAVTLEVERGAVFSLDHPGSPPRHRKPDADAGSFH